MDCYGNVIKQITLDYYEKQIDNAPKEFRHEYTEKFSDYTQMINNFNKLPTREQKNIFNLGWFILYCQNHNLDSPEKDNILRDYSNLIEQIKSLPINEQS
ncbi:hypothetical protein [Iningainema tapete]|uniref:Uncharacterized protein n=1 Tax=Iningainema tapete BLCC-T55 TaxID=2748662 RepID=A0A8J7BXX4_9CYAN|nr:hypothetical protein [Iningainema tapete]MBD2773538.1 hypothetical protein [Iningainema tapete BLCC-T55]